MTSHSSSNRNWAVAHGALQDLLQDEFPDEAPGPKTDRMQVFQDRAVLYLKYLQIFRSLEEVYEQLVQPQRRRAVRMVLDSLTGRLLELKSQMVDLELSEFHYFDELLLDLKMTPKDLEIPIPRYFLTDQMHLLRDRQTVFSSVLETQRASQKVSAVQSMSLEEAVRLLQVAERARQGRIRAQFMKELVQSERGVHRSWNPTNLTPDQAAVRIQKVWRGHVQRIRTNTQRTNEMVFLGMIPANPPGPGLVLHARRVSVGQRLIQDQNEEEYQRAQLSVKQSVLDVEGTDIRETMQEQIRQWFIECRDAAGTFPEFPDAADGGSAAIFTQKTPEQVSAELAAREEEREEKKKKKKKEEKRGGPQKKKGEEREKKKKKEVTEGDGGWMKPRSCFLSDVVEGGRICSDVWCRHDDRQTVDVQLLRDEMRQEVEQEVRLQVDELMRAELENLKLVIDKTQKKKKKKKGNRKKKKSKKKKREKDLTAHRQLITLYTVLPLGSQAVLKKFPGMKTLLLAGPSGVGKKMLVHAVCSETGAHLFHLNPAHLSTRYPGRTAYLLHLVFKVAGELQPSVIWIEDAEIPFYRKTPKTERELDLKGLKKNLLKSLKTLKLQDRVLVIGTSRRPFDANIKPLCKVYKKIILIPRPDYSSRLVLWMELLRAEGAEPGPHLDLSSLAKITDGFTQGHILQAVRSVLRPHRLKKLHLQPLTATEFIPSLSRMEPVYREEEDAFKLWFRKTLLGRRKARAAKTSEEERGATAAGKKKKKGAKDKNKK